MNSTQINSEYKSKLRKLSKSLKGHLATVAKELNVSVSSVSRVLNGDWENDTIVAKCIEVRDRLMQEKAKKLKALSEKI